MSTSAAIVDSLLRQAWPRASRGGRARRSVGQQTVSSLLPSSRLRMPVSPGDSAISRRTVMNNVG